MPLQFKFNVGYEINLESKHNSLLLWYHKVCRTGKRAPALSVLGNSVYRMIQSVYKGCTYIYVVPQMLNTMSSVTSNLIENGLFVKSLILGKQHKPIWQLSSCTTYKQIQWWLLLKGNHHYYVWLHPNQHCLNLVIMWFWKLNINVSN